MTKTQGSRIKYNADTKQNNDEYFYNENIKVNSSENSKKNRNIGHQNSENN